MKTLQPGRWVKYRDDVDAKKVHVIVHYAEYCNGSNTFSETGTGEHYFIYSFTAKGTYQSAGWVQRKDITCIKEPDFAEYVFIFPKMLLPNMKHEKDEHSYKGGMVYTKQKLVVIDTMVLSSKALTKYFMGYFSGDSMFSTPDSFECDGVVFSKKSWQWVDFLKWKDAEQNEQPSPIVEHPVLSNISVAKRVSKHEFLEHIQGY